MQKEILVTLKSSFAHLQMNKIRKEESKKLSNEDKFEEACINGLLQELLPIFFNPKPERKIYLWQVHSGFSSLQFEFGETPANIDVRYSIDPHNFLVTKCYN